MATAKQAIKESFLGATTEPELSEQTRATFNRNARQDEATGDYYMTEEDFVDAVAPANENYVSSCLKLDPSRISWVDRSANLTSNRSTK